MTDKKLSARLAGASKDGERPLNDFYPTPEWATLALLEKEVFVKNILEPCSGSDAIVDVLEKKGFDVEALDIEPRGRGKQGDFLEYTDGDNESDIITNPPFKLATEFIKKSKTVARNKIALFLKLTCLDGVKRREVFKETEFPLARVYVFSRRVTLWRNGIAQSAASGTMSFAWFIWERGHVGEPVIRWIDKSKKDFE